MTTEVDTVADVSVILPSRNRCEMLRKCLMGLAAQTYANYEVIVIDDGSTDGTSDMVSAMSRNHPDMNLIYLQNEINLGANPSRNHGIAKSRGRFVAFIDSDCLPAPQWIASLVAGFTSQRVAAVVGPVEDTPPENVFDLAILGTHRIPGPKTNRLIAGNMCIRRDLLMQFQLDEDRVSEVRGHDGSVDTSVAWGCDEEGLALSLRAADYDILVAKDAIVEHDHHYGLKSFFHQAYRGGRATARLVFKYHLPPRLDLAPWMLAYACLPLTFLDGRLAAVSGTFFCAASLAVVYNEVFRKGKTIPQLLRSFAVQVLFYQVRLIGYAYEAARLRTGRTHIKRIRLSEMRHGGAPSESHRGGRVCGIAYRRTHADAMHEIGECAVIEGRGLELEDRKQGKREVTFLSREAWSEACQDVGHDIPWTVRRVNLLVSGIDLSASIGKTLMVGEVRIRIHGETKPCQLMETQVTGLRNALKPNYRGGVHGQVVSGGIIRTGDPITPCDSSPHPTPTEKTQHGTK